MQVQLQYEKRELLRRFGYEGSKFQEQEQETLESKKGMGRNEAQLMSELGTNVCTAEKGGLYSKIICVNSQYEQLTYTVNRRPYSPTIGRTIHNPDTAACEWRESAIQSHLALCRKQKDLTCMKFLASSNRGLFYEIITD